MGNRRLQLFILLVLVCLIGTMTIAYAILSVTLNINGNAEVTAASWDIHLDNIKVTSGSVNNASISITSPTTATFSIELITPGDFYEFTIDVVNDGSIDAMIDGVTKMSMLTESQSKYLNYIVEYQNGESINTKQLVSKNSRVRLKVRIEFRNDISPLDLPMQEETLNLAFTVNYVQADTSGTSVRNLGKEILSIVSGDLETVGSEVAIEDQHFYIISSDEDSITMLAKYNLYVGSECSSSSSCISYGEEATGIQDSTMIARPPDGGYPRKGVTIFASSSYWGSVSDGTYVYDSNSTLYNYVENYKTYLESQGATIEEARLIKKEELEALECNISNNSCKTASSWIYGTSYWSGTALDHGSIWYVFSSGGFGPNTRDNDRALGVRPVIKILLSNL